jgi:hypothetical protein
VVTWFKIARIQTKGDGSSCGDIDVVFNISCALQLG